MHSTKIKVEVQYLVGSSIEFHHILPLQFFLWTEFCVTPSTVCVMPLYSFVGYSLLIDCQRLSGISCYVVYMDAITWIGVVTEKTWTGFYFFFQFFLESELHMNHQLFILKISIQLHLCHFSNCMSMYLICSKETALWGLSQYCFTRLALSYAVWAMEHLINSWLEETT